MGCFSAFDIAIQGFDQHQMSFRYCAKSVTKSRDAKENTVAFRLAYVKTYTVRSLSGMHTPIPWVVPAKSL
jgi:hypothetical protein